MLPDQFILYKMVWSEPKNKWLKLPCDMNGMTVSAMRREGWVDHATACTFAQKLGLGVAFVLSKEDNWFFLDLDDCVQNGQWTDAAQSIFLSFSGALGEVSVSGKGLHILGRCQPQLLSEKKNKWDGWLEFYTEDRFVALSPGGLSPIGGEYKDLDWTNQLEHLVPTREYLGELPEGRSQDYTGPDDDEELIKMILSSKGNAGAQFGGKASVVDLWNANVDVLKTCYPSYDSAGDFDHSSADAALMSHLAFWTGRDMPRMDRLFRRSGLMRSKYEDRADYRRDTIQKSARLCRSVYDYVKPEKSPSAMMDPSNEVYLTVPEMIDHFDGCVYIRDNHRVLVPDGGILRPEQFNATYGGHMFQMMPDGTKPTRKAFEAFTECPAHKFPSAIRTTFKPSLPPGAILEDNSVNIYVDPQVEMIPGDVSPFLEFIGKLLHQQEDREITLSYLAACVQYPGVKFQWAPVYQGCEGNGKTMLSSCVEYAVGSQYCHKPRASQLAEKYNGYIIGKMFITVEEVHMGGRREMLDELKPLITNDTVEVRVMQTDKAMVENVSNWFFCTNHRDAVIKSRNDRRYAIFFTAQQSVDDLERDGMGGSYFPNLWNWLRSGGYAHVAHYLKTYPIQDHLNPAKLCIRAPKTSSTNEAIAVSVGPIEGEILEAVAAEMQGFRGGWISSWRLDRLMKERGLRSSRTKMGEILRSMGYVNYGRAGRVIMAEDGQRPVLWCKEALRSEPLERFLEDQKYHG